VPNDFVEVIDYLGGPFQRCRIKLTLGDYAGWHDAEVIIEEEKNRAVITVRIPEIARRRVRGAYKFVVKAVSFKVIFWINPASYRPDWYLWSGEDEPE